MESIHKAQLALWKYGLGPKKEIPKFSDFAVRYLEYSKANKPAYCVERFYIPKALAPFLGRVRLNEINSLMVEKYKQQRLKLGLKKSSINREVGLLKSMLTTAVKWELLDRNGARDARLFRLDEPPSHRILSYEEEAKLMAACDEPEWQYRAPHLKPIILVALYTGLRRSKILRLRWTDIDFDNSLLLVRKAKTRAGQGRLDNLNSLLMELLLSLQQQAKSEWVFPSPYDQKKHIKDVKHSFNRAVQVAEIPRITFHHLRHTFCTRLEADGVPLSVIQELAGHASITMTRRYLHPANELKQKAVERLLVGRKVAVPATKTATSATETEIKSQEKGVQVAALEKVTVKHPQENVGATAT